MYRASVEPPQMQTSPLELENTTLYFTVLVILKGSCKQNRKNSFFSILKCNFHSQDIAQKCIQSQLTAQWPFHVLHSYTILQLRMCPTTEVEFIVLFFLSIVYCINTALAQKEVKSCSVADFQKSTLYPFQVSSFSCGDCLSLVLPPAMNSC